MHKRYISPVNWLVPSLDARWLEPLALVNLFALVAAESWYASSYVNLATSDLEAVALSAVYKGPTVLLQGFIC